MPTYLTLILASQVPVALQPIQAGLGQLVFTLQIFTITFLLPVLVMIIFRVFGTIDTFHMPTRKERILPFLFFTGIFIAFTYMMYTNETFRMNDLFLHMLLIMDALVVVVVLVTLFFRISVHSVASGGMVGLLLPLSRIFETNELLIPTVICILIGGAVMSSRLQLNAHTPREVYIGGITGLAISLIGMSFLF